MTHLLLLFLVFLGQIARVNSSESAGAVSPLVDHAKVCTNSEGSLPFCLALNMRTLGCCDVLCLVYNSAYYHHQHHKNIYRYPGTQLFSTAGFLLTNCSPGVETRCVPRRDSELCEQCRTCRWEGGKSHGDVHHQPEEYHGTIGKIMEIFYGNILGI